MRMYDDEIDVEEGEAKLEELLDSVKYIHKDMLASLKKNPPTRDEARFLVDIYYQMQGYRIALAGQIRSVGEDPHESLDFFLRQAKIMEVQIQKMLQVFVMTDQHIGDWLMHVYGVGPVISAGLIAHIDINIGVTAGKIWRFAGLDPTVTWEKGQKRPWNAKLKTLCWKIGQSFLKFQNRDLCYYGKVFAQRREIETAKNERLEYKDQAAAKLERFNFRKTTTAYAYYSEGKLPPAHIQARARRYAVKLFLSHMQWVWFETYYQQPAPFPYTHEYGGHMDLILPPRYEARQDREWRAHTGSPIVPVSFDEFMAKIKAA